MKDNTNTCKQQYDGYVTARSCYVKKRPLKLWRPSGLWVRTENGKISNEGMKIKTETGDTFMVSLANLFLSDHHPVLCRMVASS